MKIEFCESEKSKIKDALKSDKIKHYQEIEYYKVNEQLKNSTILDLMAQIEEYKQQQKKTFINWRPVNQTPSRGDSILIKTQNGEYDIIVWKNFYKFKEDDIAWVPLFEFNDPHILR